MSTARQALKRPTPLDSDYEDSDIIDLCSSSSGDEAAGGTGSADAHGDKSEDSDSEADDEAGAAALSLVVNILNACYKMIFFPQTLLRLLHRHCYQRLRGWSLAVWLWMVCACMHARDAHIVAELCSIFIIMSARTLARSRSNAARARMLLAEPAV
jgi:hypothetical protein